MQDNVWRIRLARWFGPLALRCPLSPNAITLCALALNAAAASCFYAGRARPGLFLAGMGVVVVAGLADAFDGIVARAQNKQSRYGDFLDHFADRVSDVMLAAGWLLGNGVRAELLAAAIIAITLNGYIGTQIEATWHERNYDSVGRGEFVLALIIFPIVSYVLLTNGWSGVSAGGLAVPEWLAALLVVFAALGIAQRLRLAAKLAGE